MKLVKGQPGYTDKLTQVRDEWADMGWKWGEWVRNDMDEQAAVRGCYPEIRKPEAIRKFFESYLTLSHDNAGEPFLLLDWAWEDVLKPLFGWRNPDGSRRFVECGVWIPKKNSKTQLGAGLVAWSLASNKAQNYIYSGAADRTQAKLIFEEAVAMVERCPALRSMLEINKTNSVIRNPAMRSKYEVLSKDSRKTGHGLNASMIVIDELHVVDRKLWNTLTYAGLTRKQPLTICLSTAGDDKESIAYERYEYATKVRDGLINDDSFLPVIYEAESNEKADDSNEWFKANPGLERPHEPDRLFTIPYDNFIKTYEAAKHGSPESWYNWCQLCLNVWQDNVFAWMQPGLWDACGQEVLGLDDFLGEPCWCGLDLANTMDLCSFVMCFKRDGELYSFVDFWAPEEVDNLRKKYGKAPLRSWMKAGFIHTTPGNAADYDQIRNHIEVLSDQYSIQQIAYDPWNAAQMATQLLDYGLEMLTFPQTINHYTEPMKELFKAVVDQRLYHEKNPVMRWQMQNLVARKDANENIRPDRDASRDSIDGPCSLIMALQGAILSGDGVSDYDQALCL